MFCCFFRNKQKKRKKSYYHPNNYISCSHCKKNNVKHLYTSKIGKVVFKFCSYKCWTNWVDNVK